VNAAIDGADDDEELVVELEDDEEDDGAELDPPLPPAPPAAPPLPSDPQAVHANVTTMRTMDLPVVMVRRFTARKCCLKKSWKRMRIPVRE
jgi:hypothetical protein